MTYKSWSADRSRQLQGIIYVKKWSILAQVSIFNFKLSSSDSVTAGSDLSITGAEHPQLWTCYATYILSRHTSFPVMSECQLYIFIEESGMAFSGSENNAFF